MPSELVYIQLSNQVLCPFGKPSSIYYRSATVEKKTLQSLLKTFLCILFIKKMSEMDPNPEPGRYVRVSYSFLHSFSVTVRQSSLCLPFTDNTTIYTINIYILNENKKVQR